MTNPSPCGAIDDYYDVDAPPPPSSPQQRPRPRPHPPSYSSVVVPDTDALMTDASMPSIHPSIRPFGYPPTSKTSKKTPKTRHPNVVPSFVPYPTLMTVHDSSFNTYTYIHVCILPRWYTRVISYECSVRIAQRLMVVIEEFFVREEDEDDGTRGASRRVSRLGGSVRFVRFGFYRFSDRFSGV